nr:Fn3-like domain-containing protein [Chlamydiota bacterium]
MSGFKKFILTFCLLQLRLNALIVDDTTQLFVCSPGETINHSITLSNAYDEEKKYHLSQADYSFSADGTSQFSPPQTLERSNAGWINLQTPYVTIPAEGEATIYYTISVPNNSELTGSYWSLLFIEPEEGIDSSAPDDAWAIQTK